MALTAKKVYAILKRQISDMEAKIKTPIIYRGTVATADLLPLNPDIGDMYNIESKSAYGEAGMNVAWNGVVWDTMGAPIDMSLYIKSSELADWAKQQNKPTYTADEVGALPDTTVIPSKTSELQNDSGFLTKIPDNYLSETDKTLSASGKAADAKATGDKITELSADISNKLNKNQGSENSGKIAGINEYGDIVPIFPVGVEYNSETKCLEFGSDQKMELNQGIGLDSTLTKTGSAADAGVTGKEINSLKEDLVHLEDDLSANKIIKKEPKVSHLGGYTITGQGVVMGNSNYDSYIIDMNGLKTVYVDNAYMVGYYDDAPTVGSTAVDSSRHEINLVNNTITVANNVNYIVVVNIASAGVTVNASNPSTEILVNDSVIELNKFKEDISIVKSDYFDETVLLNDGYIDTSGNLQTGYNHFSLLVNTGDKFKIKSDSGSNLRAYIIKNANGTITRRAGADSWGTIHDYDIEIEITKDEDNGTLYVNTIHQNIYGLKKAKETYVIPKESIDEHFVSNHLFGKSIVFDGDSICEAVTESSTSGTTKYDKPIGWAYRVGTRFGMKWYNHGQSGGTITAETYSSDGSQARHWVSRYVDTIHSMYPNLDYYVFEGGTNDADILRNDLSKLGTFSADDFSGNYDDTTFYGAMETIIYKMLNYYPHIKIGYIVAQKMGTNTDSRALRYSYFEKAMQICKKWGVPYINLWDDSQLNPMIASHYDSTKTADENKSSGSLYVDGQHLTSYGYDAVSSKICDFIMGL